MKKLLSLITAGALALGLIGCSGDLHDAVVTKVELTENLKVIGSNSGWADTTAPSLKAEEDGSYTAVVVADAANVLFCLAEDSSAWTNQTKEDIWTGDCSSVDNGYGAFNAKTKDLTKGSTYNFKFVPNAEGKIEVTITEAKTPDYQTLEGYYVVGDFNGWASGFTPDYLIYGGVKNPATGDVTYTTQIKATNTSITFHLSTNKWGSELGLSAEGEVELDADPVSMAGTKNIIVKNTVADRPYDVVVTVKTDKSMTISVREVKYIDVVGFKVINADDYEGKTIYFLEGWVPGNNWDNTNPSAVVTGGVAEKAITSTRLTVDSIPLQMTAPEVGGDFWGVKVGGGAKNVDNEKDFKVYILQYDCENDELSLVEAIS